MDLAIETVLSDYNIRMEKEHQRMRELSADELEKHLDEFMLAVGPNTAQLLNILAKESHAHTILEIGTSYGYSTVWLADAARAAGGKVITLDTHADKQKYAQAAVARAGLGDFVDFRLGDARDSIAAIQAPIDFVLLDLWKDLYIPCFDLFYPKLSAGALVAADNMIQPASTRPEALAYRKHVRAQADIQSILVPVGSGVELSRYTRGLDLLAV